MWRGIIGWSKGRSRSRRSRGLARRATLFGLLVLATSIPDVQARPARKARAASAVAANVQQPSEEPPPALFEAPILADPGGTRDPRILNGAEMLSLVKQYSTEISRALLMGERRREEAIRQKDGVKLACIQDHLSNMKLMKILADNRLEATGRASIRADLLNLRHEFRGVEMARERVLKLELALSECVGEDLEMGDGSTGTAGTAAPPATGGVNPDDTNVVVAPPIDRPSPATVYE